MKRIIVILASLMIASVLNACNQSNRSVPKILDSSEQFSVQSGTGKPHVKKCNVADATATSFDGGCYVPFGNQGAGVIVWSGKPGTWGDTELARIASSQLEMQRNLNTSTAKVKDQLPKLSQATMDTKKLVEDAKKNGASADAIKQLEETAKKAQQNYTDAYNIVTAVDTGDVSKVNMYISIQTTYREVGSSIFHDRKVKVQVWVGDKFIQNTVTTSYWMQGRLNITSSIQEDLLIAVEVTPRNEPMMTTIPIGRVQRTTTGGDCTGANCYNLIPTPQETEELYQMYYSPTLKFLVPLAEPSIDRYLPKSAKSTPVSIEVAGLLRATDYDLDNLKLTSTINPLSPDLIKVLPITIIARNDSIKTKYFKVEIKRKDPNKKIWGDDVIIPVALTINDGVRSNTETMNVIIQADGLVEPTPTTTPHIPIGD